MRRLAPIAALVAALAAGVAARAQGPPAAPLGATQIRVLGLAVDLDTRPDLAGLQSTMTAVKDVPSGVETFVGSLADTTARAAVPGAIVKALLSGPSLSAGPVEVAAPPNALLELPLLRVAGRHVLSNVRLEDAAGQVLLARDPALAPIEVDVIDELLVTQVTSRPLSLDEIREKGIVIDTENFTVLSFAVGLTLGSEKVTIDLPVAVPATRQALDAVDLPQLTTLPVPEDQLRKVNIPNFSLTGFRMRPPPELEEKDKALIPPIEGVIIIPGNIAFLNQFFSVVVQASNVAPGGSGLVLRDARATVALPKGGDDLSGTGDDPLRMAVIGTGPQETTQPIVDVDGRDEIQPATSNSAEFLVEGLREGAHDLRFDLTGDLFVPALGRTVALSGVAAGVVQVKNPTFSIVLSHPKVVREGEPYRLFTTVTNTSTSPANLFRISLSQRALSGAAFQPGETPDREIDTLAPGDSATLDWRLVARTTGEVTGTVFLAQEGINGSFILTTGVGDTGIPLSPDTLVLPQVASALPEDPPLMAAAVRMLGQAYSVATAPAGALPKDIARVGKPFVFDRAVRVAQAGLHVRLGEAVGASTQELLLDWLGNDRARLDVLFPAAGTRQKTESDLRAFDSLRRKAGAGENFTNVVGRVLAQDLAAAGAPGLAREMGLRFASRPGFVLAGVSGAGAPLELAVRDARGATMGRLDPAAADAREIPFAARVPLARTAGGSDELALLASPEPDPHELIVVSPSAAAQADLGLVLRDLTGLVFVTLPRIDLARGGSARVRIQPGGVDDYGLDVDADGDGVAEQRIAPASIEPLVDAPPALVAAQQWAKGAEPNVRPSFESGDPLGRLVAVLFDEEVSEPAVRDAARWALPDNAIFEVSLQPDRRTAFVVTDRPVGEFVARIVTARDIADVQGNVRASSAATIQGDPDRGLAGRVSGQVVGVDGRPIPFASVEYLQPIDQKSLEECFPRDFVVTTLQADASGRFGIDFVLQNGFPNDRVCSPDVWLNERNAGPTNHFKLEARDPDTGDVGKLSTRIQFDGQHMAVQVVIRGFASLEGGVFDEDGNPIAGGDPGTPESLQILATNLSTGEQAVSWVDAAGRYAFPRTFAAPGGATTDAPPLAVGNVALLVIRPADGLTGITTVNLPSAGARIEQDVVMTAPFRYGSVSGRVLEADGRTPAANVEVALAGSVLSGFGLAGRSVSQALLGSTVTDADGAFRFDVVPAGQIELAATRQATFEQARAQAAVSGGVETSLQFVLPGGGGTVRGIVRDALGNLVANALVAGGPTLTSTDANGRFEIRGLPRGTFTVSSRTADSPALGKVDVTTKRPDDVQDVVLTLEPVGDVSGSVFEADGATPIAAQKVQLWFGPDTAVAAETLTAQDGSFSFQGFPVGRYSVRAVRRGDFDGGMALTEIRFAGDARDADVVFRGLGEISGRVVQDNGTPVISDVLVTRKVWRIITDTGPIDNAALGAAILAQFATIPGLEDAAARAISENGLDQGPPEFFFLFDETEALRSDILGPNGEVTGRFRFRGDVTGGPFTVAAFGPFLAPAEVTGEIPRTTDPTARKVDVGDIVLEPATGAVRGTVFLPDGKTPVGENVKVKLRSLDNSGSVPSSFGTQTQPVLPEIDVVTGPNGQFEFPLVLRGRFVITADSGVPDPAIAAQSSAEIRTDAFDDANGARVLNVRLFGRTTGAVPKLPFGEFLTADVRLEGVAGTRLRVVEHDGVTPVTGAKVQLVTSSSLDKDPAAAFTDTAGEIEFFPLPEGSFTASVTVPGSPARGGATGVVPVAPRSGLELPIVVQLGSVTTSSGQILGAPIFGGVSGLVRRADGTVLSNPVEITVRAGGISVVTTSGPDGRYLAENVPGGFFRVDAFEPLTARRGSASGALVSDGEVAGADVQLVGLGSVAGTVASSDGSRALPNVDVTLTPTGSFSDRLVTRTDGQGLYTLPGVPLGPYRVEARDFQTGLAGSATGTLARDGESVTTDVVLQASGGISGVVYAPGVLLDANGIPVNPDGSPRLGAPVAAGVSVELSGPVRQTLQSAADGSFASAGFLPLGDYTVTARAPIADDGATTRVRVAFDGQVAFAALALRGQGRVEGVVLDSLGIAPVEAASVTIQSASAFSRGAATRITGADGRFAFDGVPLGAFSLTVATNLQTPPLGGAAASELTQVGETLAFADGDADPAHEAIRLQAAGSVAAQIVLGDGATPAAGTVATFERMSLRLSRVADATGTIRVDGLPLGAYTVALREAASNGVAARSVTLASNGQLVDLGVVRLDDRAPSLLSTEPLAGSLGTDPAAPLVLRFSEPIDPASVSIDTVAVALAGAPVSGTFAVNGGDVTFVPDARLPDLSRVDVIVRGDVLDFEDRVTFAGVRDLAGRGLVGDVAFAFTTADTTPPSLVSTSPADGAVEVDPRAVVRVELSEPVDPASLGGLTLETAAGAPVAGVVNDLPILGGRVLVFTPAQRLAPDERYVWRIAGPLRDAAGNAMAQATLGGGFATVDTVAPSVASVGVAPGAVLVQGRTVLARATVAASEPGVRVEFSLNGALAGQDTSDPFELPVLLAPALGASVRLGAVAIDAAGNRSAPRETLLAAAANQPPTVRILAPADGPVSQGATVLVDVEADDDLGLAELRFSANDGAVAAAAQAAGGAGVASARFSFRVPSTLPGGSTLTLRAGATDLAGLAAEAAPPVALVVGDSLAPTLTFVSPGPGAAVEPGASTTLVVRADDTSGVADLRLSATAIGFEEERTFAPGTSPASATFVVPVPANAAPGNLNVTARATDGAGNAASRVLAVRVADRRAPVVALLATSLAAEPGRTAAIDVQASDETGVVRIDVSAPGVAPLSRTLPGPKTASERFDLPVPATLALGALLDVTATAFDAAGNATTSAPLRLVATDVSPPDVTVSAPSSGALVAPGSTVAVSILAGDAFGVAQLSLAASGVAAASEDRLFAPPAATVAETFFVEVPPAAPAGAALVLDVTARDAAGNFSAPVRVGLTVADVVPPQVVSIDPADGAADVPETTLVRVTFDEPVAAASAASSLQILCGGPVPASVALSSGGRLVTLTPAAPLPLGAVCSVTVGGAVTDLAGNPLGAPVTSSFRVVPPDRIPPAVVRITPPDGATDVPVATSVAIELSEPVDPASVTFLGVVLTEGAGAPVLIDLALSSDRRTITLTPILPLATSTLHGVGVAGVADDFGNVIVPVTFAFTTAGPDLLGPELLGLEPADGAATVSVRPLLRACFDDVLDAASLGGSGGGAAPLTLDDPSAASPVPLELRIDASGRCVEALPLSALAFAAAYDLRLDPGLRGADGNPVRSAGGGAFATIVHRFTTGDFGLVSPADGATVVERTELVIEASGSPSIGIASVELSVDGAARPALTQAPFRTTIPVPDAAQASSLRIEAVARDASGSEIGRDAVTVSVAVGLRFDRPIAGVPLGATAHLRLVASSPPVADLPVAVRVHDPAVLGLPSAPLVLPAGAGALLVPVEGLAEGATAVAASSAFGETSTIAAVSPAVAPPVLQSPPAPGETLPAVSTPVGVSVRTLPSAGRLSLPAASIRSVRIRLLSAPAPSSTPVAARSSDPAVADLASSATVPAGSTDAILLIATGAAGEATLTLRAGAEGRELTVRVGPPVPDRTVPALAPPVGVLVLALPSAGTVIVAPGGTARVTVPVLAAPAAGDLTLAVASSDPAVADVPGGAVVPSGSRDATFDVVTGAPGETTITLRAGDDGRELTVIVGAPSPGRQPPVLAPPVGALVVPLPSAGDVIVTPGGTATLTVPVLDAPAASDVTLTVTSSDPTVATVSGSVVVPRGSRDVTFQLTTGTAGAATITLRDGRTGRELRVVVGAPAPDRLPPVLAPAVGATVLVGEFLGEVAVPAGATRSLDVEAFDVARAADATFTVRSSDPSVARVDGDIVVPAGSTRIALPVTTGAQGDAVLTLREVGSTRDGRSIHIVSGAPAPDRVSPTIAVPAGIAVLEPPAGALYLAPGTTRTLDLAVLPLPLPADVPVLVTSRDVSVASVTPGVQSIPAGTRTARITVRAEASGDAETILDLAAGAERQALVVVVGKPSAARIPLTVAPPVGACVDDPLAPPDRRCEP